MRRVLYLFLAVSFLSLQAEESKEETAPSKSSLNERTDENRPLLSANEWKEFKGDMAELSSEEFIEEKDSFLPPVGPKKNSLYFFLPANLSHFSLPGLAFRHHGGKDFFEVSYFNQKQGEIVLSRYKDLFEVESTEKLGSIYENLVNASYGFKWNTRYVDPYFSFGLGVYLPYVQYRGASSMDLLPTLAAALGIEFGYGFVDLAINYLPIKWTGVFAYQESGDEFTLNQSRYILANFRLGVGFPF